MTLFVAEHTHPGERCPANNPEMAQGLLQIVNAENARRRGIVIHGDAVANGKHHLFLIVDAPAETAVREYFAPFGQLGTLTVTPASHCEQVVERGHC
jgi:hypothetical protein